MPLGERGAHLAALWGLAVVAPLLHVLGFHPQIFATRGWSAAAIVLFTLVLSVVAPLALLGFEWLVGLVSEALAWALHLAVVSVLVAAIVLQVLTLDAVLTASVLALSVSMGAVLAYARSRATRSLLVVLSPAPVVFAVLFLVFSDVSDLVFSHRADVQAETGAARAPIVLVVFDELPVSSLMDGAGGVDARRFPNFARLARDATWYRNTASVDQDTPYALPAILDARLPRRERLPVAADHPRNIFTLLSGRYELHVREEATALCPPALCPSALRNALDTPSGSLVGEAGLVYAHQVLPDSLERDVPAVTEAWRRVVATADPAAAVTETRHTPREGKRHRYLRVHGNLARGRPRRFERFVTAIDASAHPQLHLVHTLLPHVPFQYLPSGRFYRTSPKNALPGLDGRPGYGVRFLVEQSYQRHLLQLQATDRLLGDLLDRLREVGVYDRALVAVVADHGISFRLGHDRRLVRAANVEDIAPVPFFVKAPGQRRGRISDKPLRTIDVLPTVADLIDLRIPWPVDGRSALRSTVAAQRHRRIIAKKFRHSYLVDAPSFASDRRAALERKKKLFGSGLYRLGPRPGLLGRRLEAMHPLPRGEEHALIAGSERFRSVDPSTGFLPTHVVGRISGSRRRSRRIVALAVNGRIGATGLTFRLRGTKEEQFSLLMPERALRPGDNRVELAVVAGNRLRRLGGSRRSQRPN
jgi:hypothetical protein